MRFVVIRVKSGVLLDMTILGLGFAVGLPVRRIGCRFALGVVV